MNAQNTQGGLLAIPSRFPAPALDQHEYLFGGQLNLVVTFAGRIDVERMVRAVRLTLDAEPALGCRFVEHPWRPYWERRDDLDTIPLCRVAEPRDLESELWRFIGTPADPSTDPQVQVCIFRSDRDTLCIKVNHAVADGIGVKEYVHLLAVTYRALAADPAYRPQPNLHGNRGLGQVFRLFGPLTLAKAYCRHTVPVPAWGWPVTANDRSGWAFAVRRIGPERFQAIKNYDRERQASMNNVLLTAFYRAMFGVLDSPAGEPLPVWVPVDLRRYLPSGRAGAICNLWGSLFPAITREPGATFDDTLTQVHAAMEAFKTSYPGLGSALRIQLSFTIGFGWTQRMLRRSMEGATKAFPVFSNPGVIERQRLDFDAEVADAHLVLPSVCAPDFLVGVSTFDGMMTFTVGYCDTATDGQLVERFMDLLIGELPA